MTVPRSAPASAPEGRTRRRARAIPDTTALTRSAIRNPRAAPAPKTSAQPARVKSRHASTAAPTSGGRTLSSSSDGRLSSAAPASAPAKRQISSEGEGVRDERKPKRKDAPRKPKKRKPRSPEKDFREFQGRRGPPKPIPHSDANPSPNAR